MYTEEGPRSIRGAARPWTVLVWITCLVLIPVWGCGGGGGEPDVTYQGKPTSEWIVMLQDADPGTRVEAIGALEAIGEPARKAVPDLVPLVQDADADVRVAAVKALTAIGEPSDEVVEVLLANLVDEELDLWNRARTEWAADVIDGLAEGPVSYAIEVDEGGGPLSHCSMTTHALVALGATEAVPDLARVIEQDAEGDEGARCAIYAIRAFGLLGNQGDARAALEAIEPGLGHEKGFVRTDAIRAIGELGWVRARADTPDWKDTGDRSVKMLAAAWPEVSEGLNAEWRENVEEAMEETLLQVREYGMDVPDNLIAQFRGDVPTDATKSVGATSGAGSGGAMGDVRVSGDWQLRGDWQVREMRAFAPEGEMVLRDGSFRFMGDAACTDEAPATLVTTLRIEDEWEEYVGEWCRQGAWLLWSFEQNAEWEDIRRCSVEAASPGVVLDCRFLADDPELDSRTEFIEFLGRIDAWRTQMERGSRIHLVRRR